METEANALFDVYRKLYFTGGVSSVYFFETVEDDKNAFGATFLIHHGCIVYQRSSYIFLFIAVPSSSTLLSGEWDSIHVFDCKLGNDGKWAYQLTSCVMVNRRVLFPCQSNIC